MALTAKQLERRQHSLGGSDIACLLGHSPMSQYDLWLQKKHGISTFDGNDATEFGHVVEGGIADWAAGQLEVKIRKNVFRAHRTLPFHANLDAVVVGADEAIEVKSSSFKVEELWGEPNTDEVPNQVVCQAQWQALLAELDLVHVAAALMPNFGGQKLRLFRVGRNEELIEALSRIALEWWERFVVGDEVPTDLPSDEAMKAVERVPESEIEIDIELVRKLKAAKFEAKIANDLVKDARGALMKALYDPTTKKFYEAGVVGDKKVTYFRHYRKPESKLRAGAFYRKLSLPKEL